jgi:hypothetical protein
VVTFGTISSEGRVILFMGVLRVVEVVCAGRRRSHEADQTKDAENCAPGMVP